MQNLTTIYAKMRRGDVLLESLFTASARLKSCNQNARIFYEYSLMLSFLACNVSNFSVLDVALSNFVSQVINNKIYTTCT
jgi:hypothetical protein